MSIRIFLVFLVMLSCGNVLRGEEPPLFPFVVSYDSPPNATNVSGWLPKPAGAQGFVRAEGERLLVGLPGDKLPPLRLWATNICFGGSFPAHEQAQRVAERLARLGINCVRLHHMDMRDIWGKSGSILQIDPEQLERLDYLIYQLKLQGVYVNINLHVSRTLDEASGFTGEDQRPSFDKGLDNFEPRMIELQKKYAKDLLTHVNPYTKTAYTDEPCVACVEINNENSLFSEWSWGSIDRLPEPYAGTFKSLWNAWLKKKYGSTDKLRKAWNAGEQPLGDEMLKNGDFSAALTGAWYLESDAKAQASMSIRKAGPQGKPYMQVKVERMGEVSWHPQISQTGFAVKKGQVYTLTLLARAETKRRIGFNCLMAHDPWQALGFQVQVEIGPEWKEIRRSFAADRDDANARLTLTQFAPGEYGFAAVSLRPGGVMGLAKDERLEDNSVPVMLRHESSMTEAAQKDFIAFLWDTERDYWWGMYRYLKDDLKVRSIVAGTQLGWSPPYVQAGLDFIDNHAYWHHPEFPNRQWDMQDWKVQNAALVNSPAGTLGGLAARRVAGMAYTVSEYNHPAPIAYAAEGFPMIAAFGALQGWNGIYSFAYSHNADFEPRRLTSFFDIKSDPTRLVHMPACAAMFLRGDVARAKETVAVKLTRDDELRLCRESMSAWGVSTDSLGLNAKVSLEHAIALDIGKDAAKTAAAKTDGLPKPAAGPETVSDTGQIRWNNAEKDAGYFTVSAPRSKLFTGFVRRREFNLGGVMLKIGPTRMDWATVSMVCIDGQGFDKPGRVLIAATGFAENQGAKLEKLPDGAITLRDQWGDGPVLCEGISAEITLPSGRPATLYPLDEAGNRRAATPTATADGKTLLKLDPKQKTLWYEVDLR